MNPSTPNKLLIPAVIVIVALILVGGIYWIHYSQSVNQPAINVQNVVATPAPGSSSQNPVNASSTATSTAGWKTYTNKNYGFSFQYPSSLIPVDKNSQVDLDLGPLNSLKNIQSVSISISNNPGPCGQQDDSYPNPLRHQSGQDFTNVQGISFQFFSTGDSGMGQYSLTALFRTERSGNCYVGALGSDYTRDDNNSQWLQQTNAAMDNYILLLKQIMTTVTITN